MSNGNKPVRQSTPSASGGTRLFPIDYESLLRQERYGDSRRQHLPMGSESRLA